MIKRLTFILLLSIVIFQSKGQIIENFRQEIIGDEVNIYYDLIANIEGQIFEVILFCSDSSSYTHRLYFAQGDVGKDVQPGKNKKIVWTNKDELTSYSIDNLQFEVRANIQSSALYFIYPRDRNTIFKRGTIQRVEWLGGEINENLVIELFRYDTRQKVIANTSNKGNLLWTVPLDLKPGVDYQFRIRPANKQAEPVYSSKFQVRRKIPLALKIVPSGLVLGAIGYFIFKTDDTLPEPPGPPDS